MPLADLQAEIATRLRRGELLARLEDEVIAPSPLTDDAKAALWLYGWCLLNGQAQRTEARPHPGQPWSRRPVPGSAAPGQSPTRR
jgi:hypothetical protein